jgi:RNA polymerase-binding transcription factor DksA
MDEIPPVKKSRLVTLFKRKRELPEEPHRHESENQAPDDDSPENMSDDSSEGEDREMHRKWRRKHPALLNKYLKKHLGKIKKAFFIDRKV